MNERTRTFKATYTSNDNEKHVLNVKVFRRLGSFGLALVLVGSLTGCHLMQNGEDVAPSTDEEPTKVSDMELIESIIAQNPDMLKIITSGTYTVGFGDSLSSIAEANGNTVKRICYLNDIDPKAILRTGKTLKIETIKRLEGIDADIVCLESYFHDYLLNSYVGILAKKTDSKNPQDLYLRGLIFGEPETAELADPSSLYGRYIDAYKRFHIEREEEVTEEDKKNYVEELLELEEETVSSLYCYMGSVIKPYSQYKVYLVNGTTKYDTIQEVRRTVYD